MKSCDNVICAADTRSDSMTEPGKAYRKATF